jgi:hypothetical protein
MIRLREKITNEKESVWERDLLQNLLKREKELAQADLEAQQ